MFFFELLFLIPLFLIWGSFLNVLGYRLIRNQTVVWGRSACPHCKNQIAWYDNIPLVSWCILQAQCRMCKQPISILYPFIELLTVILLSLLYVYIPHQYFLSYFIFFSALIVTIRSDLECMLISRYVTLCLIPLGLLLSLTHLLPISFTHSMLGIVFGYGVLFGIAQLFYLITNKEGLGQGDIDLLAFIGSFTGVIGCWATILIGSTVGSVIGMIYMVMHRPNRQVKIPFGPFLAFGAIIFIFFQDMFTHILLGL
ncbi:MAG TPA: prepilin peptidase [Candidatus Dependentiae bacterium]|nr:prepilin peptidase [Candidatus Dependentiae bacterium]HRQ62715.1 prepilin peptidase [Candidatus Dependentiae bacterium]